MKRIVIAQRGWVFVGDFSIEDGYVVLRNAQNVHKWGTTKGLAEIALCGPTDETVLHPAGIVRVHELAVVATIDCVPEKWAKV